MVDPWDVVAGCSAGWGGCLIVSREGLRRLAGCRAYLKNKLQAFL